MSLQVNSLNTVQSYSKPQVNTAFKANPVATTNTLERTPTTDTLVKPTQNKTKKTLLTLGAIATGGIGIAYAIKKAQVKNIKNVQKSFQKVFMRDDITIEETKKMLSRYKEIEKITDREEYIKALFKEVKKNFGMEKTDIKLIFEDMEGAAGFCKSDNSAISITPNCPRKHILNTMHHEFRHAKQHELIYLLDPKLAKRAFFNIKDNPQLQKEVEELITKAGKDCNVDIIYEQLVKRYEKELEQKVLKRYGNVDKNKLSGEIKEFAEKLKNAQDNYTSLTENISEYWQNFMEVDARFAGNTSEKFIRGKAFNIKPKIEDLAAKFIRWVDTRQKK